MGTDPTADGLPRSCKNMNMTRAQSVIKLLRESDFGIDMQFTNYRTN